MNKRNPRFEMLQAALAHATSQGEIDEFDKELGVTPEYITSKLCPVCSKVMSVDLRTYWTGMKSVPIEFRVECIQSDHTVWIRAKTLEEAEARLRE